MYSSRRTEGGSNNILLYSVLGVGVAAIALATLYLGVIAGLALSLVPLVLIALVFCIQNPYWALMGVFTMNYFILGITRYVPAIPGGVVIDALLGFTVLLLLIRSCYRKVGWQRARNGLTVATGIWLVYCSLELVNPSASPMAWFTSIRGIAFYSFIIVILTAVLFYHYRDLRRVLYFWSVFTLLAVLKAFIQRQWGFDSAELRWLFVDGGYMTHIIYSGVRYFSFFSDAANFGAGMGFSMVVFSIAAIYYNNKWIKAYFLIVAAAACYGMVISGTRGALAVPFVGYALYLILARKKTIIAIGVPILLGAFVFLNYTHIGHGNALIRRMRSAFDVNDASFQVRLNNQKLLWEYMKDKPFGGGIGMGGGKAKAFAPGAFLSQIPTDSWFVMIWVETGIVGLALHLGILFYILMHGAWLVMFRLRDEQLRGIVTALIAGIAGIIITSYGNEILGQFPTGIIVYMSQAFIFLSPMFDKEIARKKSLKSRTDAAPLSEDIRPAV